MAFFASGSELNFCIMHRPNSSARRSFRLGCSSRISFLTAASLYLERIPLGFLLIEQLLFLCRKLGEFFIGIRYFFSLKCVLDPAARISISQP